MLGMSLLEGMGIGINTENGEGMPLDILGLAMVVETLLARSSTGSRLGED